jgi:hypothetical protein
LPEHYRHEVLVSLRRTHSLSSRPAGASFEIATSKRCG